MQVVIFGHCSSGIAIVEGIDSKLGGFRYKCGKGSWNSVSITNTKPLGKDDFINVIYLKPDDSVKFEVKSSLSFWTPIEAVSKARYLLTFRLNEVSWFVLVCGMGRRVKIR